MKRIIYLWVLFIFFVLAVPPSIAQEPVKEWKLAETFFITTIAIDDDGRIYAVDRDQNHVSIFDADGALIRTVGREGKGPGELRRPRAIALAADGETFVVRDQVNRRVSLFSREGDFQQSFAAPQILPSSSIAFVGDSLLVFGGFLPKSLYTGTNMHLYTVDGEKRRSFFPQSEKAKAYKQTVRVGAGFDVDDQGRFYAVQPVDYTIHQFGPMGEPLREIDISPLPDHFRQPRTPQPNPLEGREPVIEWLETVDGPRNVFVVDEEVLAVSIQKGGGDPRFSTVDFIDASTGTVIRTVSLEGKLVYADPNRGWIYVAEPQDEPVTLLQAYRLGDLLESG